MRPVFFAGLRLCIALLLGTGSSLLFEARAQEGDLPFPPEEIYDRISRTNEQLIEGMDLPEELSVAEWQADLDTLAALLQRRLPYADAALGPHHLTRRLDSLKALVPQQTRDQRILSVFRLMNLPAAGTGHTRIFASQRVLGWRAVPFRVYRFDDGVFIMAAADTSLIGREVVAIDGTPIEDVYDRLAPYVSADNRWSRQTHVHEHILEWANPLHALGITDRVDQFALHLRTERGGTASITVQTLRPDTPAFVRYITSPASMPVTPPERQWSPASVQEDSNEPFYRTTYDEATGELYLEFNTVVNETRVDRFSDQSIADLADSLRTLIEGRPLERFIVDLRTNLGGITADGDPLVELLSSHPTINRRGVLYTLLSPYTHSAAGLFAMKLEQRTKTLFAGQPSGFSPTIWGEISPVLLPNSKILIYTSYAYYQGGLPDTPRTFIEPDLRVPFTARQHFENVDSTRIAVRTHTPEPIPTVALSPDAEARFVGTYRMTPSHRARIERTEGGLAFHMTRGETEPFIESDLHPLSATSLATDMTGVTVERRTDGEGLALVTPDTSYTLAPVEGAFTLPLEHIRADRFAEGAAGLRAARDAGVRLGTDFLEYPLTDLLEENPIPAWPDTLSQEEKARRALPYAELSAELLPMSWRVQADLAMTYQVLGRTEAMRRAAQRVVDADPRRAGFVREYLGLEVTNDGVVQAPAP